jgi:hypothetical protein
MSFTKCVQDVGLDTLGTGCRNHYIENHGYRITGRRCPRKLPAPCVQWDDLAPAFEFKSTSRTPQVVNSGNFTAKCAKI